MTETRSETQALQTDLRRFTDSQYELVATDQGPTDPSATATALIKLGLSRLKELDNVEFNSDAYLSLSLDALKFWLVALELGGGKNPEALQNAVNEMVVYLSQPWNGVSPISS